MITLLAFLGSVAISLGAVFVLRASDEKRHRVVDAAPSLRGVHSGVLWIVMVSPGVGLLASSQYSAFLSWFGALTVLGWISAFRQPAHSVGGEPERPDARV